MGGGEIGWRGYRSEVEITREESVGVEMGDQAKAEEKGGEDEVGGGEVVDELPAWSKPDEGLGGTEGGGIEGG